MVTNYMVIKCTVTNCMVIKCTVTNCMVTKRIVTKLRVIGQQSFKGDKMDTLFWKTDLTYSIICWQFCPKKH